MNLTYNGTTSTSEVAGYELDGAGLIINGRLCNSIKIREVKPMGNVKNPITTDEALMGESTNELTLLDGFTEIEDLFTETYLPYADEQTKTIFRAILSTARKQNDIIKEQREEIEYKEDVIIGLVDNISLAEKRQILNRVVRYNRANYQERWALLYREFENKYHIDLQKRIDRYNKENKPKCKGKLDYIDKVMNKIPELYEIAVKLFENDMKSLVKEIYEIV